MQTEDPFVLLPSARPELLLLDPASGVTAEQLPTTVRVHPLAPDDLSLPEREPDLGVLLLREPLRRLTADAIRRRNSAPAIGRT